MKYILNDFADDVGECRFFADFWYEAFTPAEETVKPGYDTYDDYYNDSSNDGRNTAGDWGNSNYDNNFNYGYNNQNYNYNYNYSYNYNQNNYGYYYSSNSYDDRNTAGEWSS